MPREKGLRAGASNNNKLNPHITPISLGIKPKAHWWQASALTTAPIPASLKWVKNHSPCLLVCSPFHRFHMVVGILGKLHNDSEEIIAKKYIYPSPNLTGQYKNNKVNSKNLRHQKQFSTERKKKKKRKNNLVICHLSYMITSLYSRPDFHSPINFHQTIEQK